MGVRNEECETKDKENGIGPKQTTQFHLCHDGQWERSPSITLSSSLLSLGFWRHTFAFPRQRTPVRLVTTLRPLCMWFFFQRRSSVSLIFDHGKLFTIVIGFVECWPTVEASTGDTRKRTHNFRIRTPLSFSQFPHPTLLPHVLNHELPRSE